MRLAVTTLDGQPIWMAETQQHVVEADHDRSLCACMTHCVTVCARAQRVRLNEC